MKQIVFINDNNIITVYLKHILFISTIAKILPVLFMTDKYNMHHIKLSVMLKLWTFTYINYMPFRYINLKCRCLTVETDNPKSIQNTQTQYNMTHTCVFLLSAVSCELLQYALAHKDTEIL